MRQVARLTNCKVGQTIEFIYHGGTEVGGRRRVKVTEVETDRIRGTIGNNNMMRCYLNHKAGQVTIAKEAREVTPGMRVQEETMGFVQARTELVKNIELMDGETLARLLADVNGGKDSSYRADTGEVTIEYEVPQSHFEVAIGDTRCSIYVVNSDNKTLEFSFWSDNDTFVNGDIVTPEELLSKLSSHLGG